MASRISCAMASFFKTGLKGAVLLAVLLYPTGRFSLGPTRPLHFLQGTGTTGTVEVPLEDVSRGSVSLAETELVRQVLRIIDQHYVARDRLDPVRLLQAGFVALAKETHEDVEFVRDIEPSLHRSGDRGVVSLCVWRKEKRVSLCDRSEGGGGGLGHADRTDHVSRSDRKDVAGGLGNASSSGRFGKLPFEVPAVRVGERVFTSNQSPSIGMRYIESLARPVLSELIRTRRTHPEKAMHAFLNGLLDELDPHSGYLSFDEYKELRSGTRGQFGGVGLVIDEVHELPLIREIVPNSPAHMAGIKPGDVLLRVGSRVVSFLPLEQVLREIREVTMEQPTPVWLFRPSSGRLFRVFLTREEIPTRSVETKVVLGRPDVLHVRVTGFSSHTADDILQAYEDANRVMRGSLRMFVLDLRGNPGGLLDQAIQVADLFLHQGRIVSTRSRYDEQVEFATKGQKIDLPVTVLVNSSSASASEIVAGALKDHDRALIVGERSFGKGSVQSLFELGGGTALKLTIAHYFTPSGQSLQSVGVLPHVQVKLVQMRPGTMWMSGASEPEREESLSAHLDNPGAGKETGVQGTAHGDEGVVWAHTAPNLGRVEGLEELNFSYPSIENLDAVTDLAVDSVARVAVSFLDRVLERNPRFSSLAGLSLGETVRQVQQSEARVLRMVGGAQFADKKISASKIVAGGVEPPRLAAGNGASFSEVADAFFNLEGMPTVALFPSAEGGPLSLVEPVRPRIGGFEKLFVRSGFSEHGVNTCCTHDAYTFRVTGDMREESGRAVTGFVGMRLQNNVDGNFVWAPARLTSEGKGVWLGVFDMPQVFRAYQSESGRGAESGVTFVFKRGLASPALLLGVLPLEGHRGTHGESAPLAQLFVHLRKHDAAFASGGPPVAANGRAVALGARPLEEPTLHVASGPGEYNLQVKVPSKGLTPGQKYDLMLVPLSDGRVELKDRVVSLQVSPTGDFVAEIHITLKEKETLLKGQDFGGVIGGILRTGQGDVVGKWPLAYIDEDSVRAANDGNDKVKPLDHE